MLSCACSSQALCVLYEDIPEHRMLMLICDKRYGYDKDTAHCAQNGNDHAGVVT